MSIVFFIKAAKWFRKSFEYRGKASARKLTTFASFVLLNAGFIVHLYSGNTIQKEYVYLYATITLLGLGYLTAENIVDIVKGSNNITSTFWSYGQNIVDNNGRVDNPDQQLQDN
jgi:hypothetical protein